MYLFFFLKSCSQNSQSEEKGDAREKCHFDAMRVISESPLNPLSTNPTKWSNTLKIIRRPLPMNCLSVSGHFVSLTL